MTDQAMDYETQRLIDRNSNEANRIFNALSSLIAQFKGPEFSFTVTQDFFGSYEDGIQCERVRVRRSINGSEMADACIYITIDHRQFLGWKNLKNVLNFSARGLCHFSFQGKEGDVDDLIFLGETVMRYYSQEYSAK